MTKNNEDIILRSYESQDIPQLIDLWSRIFKDPQLLVQDFFSLLPEMGSGCVAAEKDRIVAAAYLIHGFDMIIPDSSSFCCGYLYAVAVDESLRRFGLGTAVSRGAVAMGRQCGAEAICTLPAEESLYRWYEDILSMCHRSTRVLYRCQHLPPSVSLSASEYLAEREAILASRPHVRPSNAAITFQEKLCEAYDGGLFRFEDGIFCASREGQEWLVPELLLFNSAKSVPHAFSSVHSPYLCSDRLLPDGFVWNLTFD